MGPSMHGDRYTSQSHSRYVRGIGSHQHRRRLGTPFIMVDVVGSAADGRVCWSLPYPPHACWEDRRNRGKPSLCTIPHQFLTETGLLPNVHIQKCYELGSPDAIRSRRGVHGRRERKGSVESSTSVDIDGTAAEHDAASSPGTGHSQSSEKRSVVAGRGSMPLWN